MRPTKRNENFQRTWKAIYRMQHNGVAVILPRMSHHYDKGGEDDPGGVVVSDYVTLEKGFQLYLCIYLESMQQEFCPIPLRIFVVFPKDFIVRIATKAN